MEDVTKKSDSLSGVEPVDVVEVQKGRQPDRIDVAISMLRWHWYAGNNQLCWFGEIVASCPWL